jgi:transcription termination/antitermination protein NusG
MSGKLFPLYVINCLSGKEDRTRGLVSKILPGIPTLLPRRKLLIRREGRTVMKEQCLFPGYFFIHTEDPLGLYQKLNGIEGFIRILWDNNSPTPLPLEEGELIQNLISGEGQEEIDISKGFIKDGQVTVTEGPLKEFAGRIKEIDRRKSRALVELNFFNRTMRVWLGLEIIEQETRKK